MAEKQATESFTAGNDRSSGQKEDRKFLQVFTLIALPLLWAGYAFALYNGNDGKISSYSLLIVAFSLANFRALCGTEKFENTALDILAKLDGVLFFLWAVITIISVVIK
ncbi:MAG: hypothetical protein K2O84_10405 [Oscillospiraceae bacterium]|jgi:preprotein translocase subunit SecG|nr:hypothetical protein [Oscillospiraceae bacterium]